MSTRISSDWGSTSRSTLRKPRSSRTNGEVSAALALGPVYLVGRLFIPSLYRQRRPRPPYSPNET